MSNTAVKNNLTLITGGTRSGKSELAESMAADSALDVYYLATMASHPEDPELKLRIERHVRRRPENWVTIEVPLKLESAVANLESGPGFVIIDCLSLFVSNLLLQDAAWKNEPYQAEDLIKDAVYALLRAIELRCDLDFVLVTNEVGWGVVPPTGLGRAYRDILGDMNRLVAGQATAVYLCCAGLKLAIKTPSLVPC